MPQSGKPTHEQRLAQKLRENLRRRKDQAKARAANAVDGPDGEPPVDPSDPVALKPGRDSDS
jgi:hypothetical protein